MDEELTPITPIYKKPSATEIIVEKVKQPALIIRKASLSDKIAASTFWVGLKHFAYGFVLAGGGALAAGAVWPAALGVAVTGGAAEATRKVLKEKNKKDGAADWADVLDKLLAIVLELMKSWRAKKK